MTDATDPSPRPPAPGWVVAAVLALTAAGAGLRLMNVGQSLWLDELHTAWATAAGFVDVPPRVLAGNNPPLFGWLVWLSIHILGPTELAYRLPSLVAGTLVIPAAGYLGRRLSGSAAVGVLAAGLVAVDGLCINYAAYSRVYALLQLATLVMLAGFWAAWHDPRPAARAVFVLAAASLFHLHYTGPLAVLGVVGFAAAGYRHGWPTGYRPWRLALDIGMAAVVWLPAVPGMLAVAGRRTMWKLMVESVQLEGLATIFPVTAYLLVPLAAAALAWGLAPPARTGAGPDARPLYLLFCAYFLPLATAWAVSRANLAPVFHARFTLVAHLPLVIGAALVTASLPGRVTRAAFLGTAVLLTQTSTGPARKLLTRGEPFPRVTREDWREAVDFVNTHDTDPGWPVLIRSGLIESDPMLAANGADPRTQEYLTFAVHGPYRFANADRPVESLRFDGTLAGKWQVDELRAAGGGWFIFRAAPDVADQMLDRIRSQLRAAGLTLEPGGARFDGANISVIRARVRPGRGL